MRYLLCLLLPMLLAFGCAQSPPSSDDEYPELFSLETYEHYLDTLGDSQVDTVTTEYYGSDETDVTPVEYNMKRINAKPAHKDTIQADTTTVPVVKPFVDSLNQVLGVTDLIFVWEGDTCTTSRLDNFLKIFEGNCLTEKREVVKSHLVFLMFTGLVTGNPTGGAIRANDYLSSVLPCGGLSEYISYFQLYEQQ